MLNSWIEWNCLYVYTKIGQNGKFQFGIYNRNNWPPFIRHPFFLAVIVLCSFVCSFFFSYSSTLDHQILEMVEAILIVWHIQINWYLVCMWEHILRNLFIKSNFRFYYGVDLLCWISTIQCGCRLKRMKWVSTYCWSHSTEW